MKKLYLIVNPEGGAKKGLDILEKVEPIFSEADIELTILKTKYAGHAEEYANKLPYAGYDGLCAIGGDGTMHEVINGMLKRYDTETGVTATAKSKYTNQLKNINQKLNQNLNHI